MGHVVYLQPPIHANSRSEMAMSATMSGNLTRSTLLLSTSLPIPNEACASFLVVRSTYPNARSPVRIRWQEQTLNPSHSLFLAE